LGDGYHAAPRGKLVNAVTCLEMRARPVPRSPARSGAGWQVVAWPSPDIDAYRALFRAVGADWLWTSRLELSDEALSAILASPDVEVFRLMREGEVLGLLELDFRVTGECEISYFGLMPQAIGQGAGRFLMDFAIDRAWAAPISRFWVHTCHFDHPAALGFYQRSGFTPYAMMAEVIDDPRVTGLLPREAAPHVPILKG
jgi:GNAT superfamily N-acetyltransferase